MSEYNSVRNAFSTENLDNVVDLYIRVSTNEQAKEGYSIGEQEARLRSYCEAMRWTIHKVHIDPGYSGGSTDRPALQELIKDVESGQIKKVVVYKLDRLSRSQLDTLFLIEKVFLANNVDFVSMNENFDTGTPFGRAMIGILAVFAQLEREQIKERMGMGKEARAKEGKWGGGSSEPIGYDYNIVTGELEVNEYEKMQILEAIDLFIKGTPLRTICTIFDNKGYMYRGRSSKPRKWDPKRLKYVFANKIYIGYIRYHDEWFPGSHPAIIDLETHEKLAKLLQGRSQMYEKHKRRCSGQTTYLGGLLYCKHCGGKYAKNTWPTRKGERHDFYTCYSRSNKVPKMVKDPNCKNKNWRKEELDNIVLGEIKTLAMNPDYYHTLRNENLSKTDNATKISLIKNEIEKLNNQISRFMDLYGLGQIPVEQITEKVTSLNEQRTALERELDSICGSDEIMTEEEVAEIVCSFDEVLSVGELNEVRAVIEALIDHIEIDNEDVCIHWKFA